LISLYEENKSNFNIFHKFTKKNRQRNRINLIKQKYKNKLLFQLLDLAKTNLIKFTII